jgi:hypothetical protein
MNMVMMMPCGRTGGIAECVFQTSFIIKNFVNKSSIEKGLKGSVDGNPVKCIIYFLFDISMGKGIFLLQEKVENLLAVRCGAKLEVP